MFKAIVSRPVRTFRAVRALQTPPAIPAQDPNSAGSLACHEVQPMLLSREDAAKYLGVSAKTLATWADLDQQDWPVCEPAHTGSAGEAPTPAEHG